jgi:hypothetical protein
MKNFKNNLEMIQRKQSWERFFYPLILAVITAHVGFNPVLQALD